MKHTGILVIAAGSSTRLGQPKQLLPYQGKTLLQHVIAQAREAGAEPIVVVTGAHAAAISTVLEQEPVETVFNAHWAEGKASSIVAGLHYLLNTYPETRKIILSVCDQPYVSAALFKQLDLVQEESGKNIVASAYAGTLGTPVLFTRKYFHALLELHKEEGAKKLLALNKADVAQVDFPQGYLDIDTMEDYEKLLGEDAPALIAPIPPKY